ncbi:MAG: NADH-quinone oxidoreductase subunit C [Saprospiraceae bacterium]|nr:NADH-quinone oxidoreductase subunit C [Saprospiraceae bacterium]
MNQLTHEQIQTHLISGLGENFKTLQDDYGVFTIELPVSQLYRTVQFLYRDEHLGFQFLTDLCGVHYPDERGRELAVVYHLHSMRNNTRMRIKTFVSQENPQVPSVSGIYASANWMERETYDFYGILFLGHPDLRRILNMDEMVGFPLRKEYPLEDPLREDKQDFHFGR